jgi:hypothetical protein
MQTGAWLGMGRGDPAGNWFGGTGNRRVGGQVNWAVVPIPGVALTALRSTPAWARWYAWPGGYPGLAFSTSRAREQAVSSQMTKFE